MDGRGGILLYCLSLSHQALKALTCTYACLIPRLVCRIITVQPFVWITDISFIAEVPRLLGTHLTAPTAIPHQAHSRSTIGFLTRACTGPVAKLFSRVHFQGFCRSAFRWRVQLPRALGPTAEQHLIKKKQFLIPMYNFIETKLLIGKTMWEDVTIGIISSSFWYIHSP